MTASAPEQVVVRSASVAATVVVGVYVVVQRGCVVRTLAVSKLRSVKLGATASTATVVERAAVTS